MTKAQEKQQYQAEEDAYVMARYQEIAANKARMQRAVKVANQRAKDLETQAKTMRQVAKRGSSAASKTKKK